MTIILGSGKTLTSDEYRRASDICAKHTDADHAEDQYRPCSGSFIEARGNGGSTPVGGES